MCKLSDGTLMDLLELFVDPADIELVNPASIDIRIGADLIRKRDRKHFNLRQSPYLLHPNEFVLVSTYEKIMVPNGYVVDLVLKSTTARQGFDHARAGLFDPGWSGIGTMEIRNDTEDEVLVLEYGKRFAQIIVETLDKPALCPYRGRYQHATTVEAAKG